MQPLVSITSKWKCRSFTIAIITPASAYSIAPIGVALSSSLNHISATCRAPLGDVNGDTNNDRASKFPGDHRISRYGMEMIENMN